MAVTITNPGQKYLDPDGVDVGPLQMTAEALTYLCCAMFEMETMVTDPGMSDDARVSVQYCADLLADALRSCGVQESRRLPEVSLC